MAHSRTKLAQALSAEELDALCERLRQEPNLTGARLQSIALEKGISIGHNSANEFLNKEFDPWLAKLKRQKGLAEFIAENADPHAATTIADAAASQLSQEVFEFLQEADVELNLFDSEGEGLEKAKSLSLIIQRLRSGDHRLKALQLKVRDMEKREKEIRETVDRAKKKGGMSEETASELNEWLGWKPEVQPAA